MDLRSWLSAGALYLLHTVTYLSCARGRLGPSHANHFALQAEAWAHGQLALLGDAARYARHDDIALFDGAPHMSFPPFPALLMLPGVWLTGSAQRFPDGLMIVLLAGLAPALLFLALERLRLDGRSAARRMHNISLAIAHGLGSVYFFTAVQGSVWFAGHVVGSILLCAFLWAAQRARHPWLCGLLAGALFATRPTSLLACSWFVFELWQSRADHTDQRALCFSPGSVKLRAALAPLRRERTWLALLQFALPLSLSLLAAALYNHARFGVFLPQAFGHEHLQVIWQSRIQKWGLFHWHYLPKNLGIMTSSLPWPRPPDAAPDAALFRINEHGLALWLTTPLYLLLLRPRRRSALTLSLWLAAIGPCALNLLYQNSGWVQFGYRFSNDYAPLLFLLLSAHKIKQGKTFQSLLTLSIIFNLFGAVTFGRKEHAKYYFRERTQAVIYQPD